MHHLEKCQKGAVGLRRASTEASTEAIKKYDRIK